MQKQKGEGAGGGWSTEKGAAVVIAATLLVLGGGMMAGAVLGPPGIAVGGGLAVAGVVIVLGVIALSLSGGGSGSTSCFVQGTDVLMADLTQKPIEQISVNDLVLSRHEKTGLTAGRRVTKVFVHDVDSTLRFGLASGKDLGTTEAHRFALGVGNFSPARSIEVGSKLCTDTSNTQLVHREIVPGRAKVYNLAVEEFHTYFVGHDRVWVHNAKMAEGEQDSDQDKDKQDKDT